MIEFEDLLDNVNVEVKKYLDSMEMVSADKVGLDIRAGCELFVGEECIAVHSSQDRALKYYGGFEYVNDMDRTQLGDYVFYSNNATRVADCLDYLLESDLAPDGVE